MAGKQTFTAEEAAAYEKQVVDRNNVDHRTGNAEADVASAYNQFWYDRGTKAVGTRRTSLIVDPPDGHIPALTPEAQKRVKIGGRGSKLMPPMGRRAARWASAAFSGPRRVRPCCPAHTTIISRSSQTRDRVVILNEMIHDARVIPLDGSPHLPSNIREWMGDSRGHWDGNTLVVDTTNFSDEYSFRGSDRNLHLTERFTRTSPDTSALRIHGGRSDGVHQALDRPDCR